MPYAWVHATLDLIVFGRPYFDLHQEKDKAHETLGPKHRIVDHEWYQAFDKLWTFSDPFPSCLKEFTEALRDEQGADRAEELQVRVAHDYFDRVWDDLSPLERKGEEASLIRVLLDPRILENWAGVDVVNGRIHRVVEDQEIWEACPETKSEYKKLRRYVATVVKSDKSLQRMLERYG